MEAEARNSPDEARGLLQRLGLVGDSPDLRFCWCLIAVLLVAYAVSFALFYPRTMINHDEADYVNQTLLLFEGSPSVTRVDAFTGEERQIILSTYPLGTALLAAPWVALVGWRGAFVSPCIALLVGVLLLARWLREEGHSPAFALILLGFPPALVMGRVVMSGVPSAAWVVLGLWFFWRGLDRGTGWWVASGFVAGASLVLRVSNPLMFVPLFAGTVLRRDSKWWALVAGGVMGLATRPLSMHLYFGDAMLERSGYFFAPETIGERLPLFLFGLLVLVPGGLLVSMLYRGRRRPEVVSTILLFFGFYLFQTFSTVETSPAKRLILALRYFIPVVPLIAFAMAEATPRLVERFLGTADIRRRRLRLRLVAGLVAGWLVVVFGASVAVHPVMARWTNSQAEIREAIEAHVPAEAVLVTNWNATHKFLSELERVFEAVKIREETPERALTLSQMHPQVFVVVMDRSDSAYWLGERELNGKFIAGLESSLDLLADIRPTATDRLRIWRMVHSSSAGY